MAPLCLHIARLHPTEGAQHKSARGHLAPECVCARACVCVVCVCAKAPCLGGWKWHMPARMFQRDCAAHSPGAATSCPNPIIATTACVATAARIVMRACSRASAALACVSAAPTSVSAACPAWPPPHLPASRSCRALALEQVHWTDVAKVVGKEAVAGGVIGACLLGSALINGSM